MSVKRITESKNVDISLYHNSDTGETLSSELGKGVIIKVTKETDKKLVSFDDYTTISTEAVVILMKILNNSDLANALKMSLCVKTPMSLLHHSNNKLHSNKTLREYLEISSESTFFALVNKLIKVGILYQIKGLFYGKVQKAYMMNPHFSRKGKSFDDVVINTFKEFQFNDNKQLKE